MQNKFIKLVASLSLPFVVGSIGSYFTIPSIDSWYSSLNKPTFSPPNWVFGPAWVSFASILNLAIVLLN